jgi:ribonuclease HII
MIEHESRSESAYRVGDFGRLRFLVDADAQDPLVGLASLVGKYIREQMMARLTRFVRKIEPSVAAVSGYRDPNTAKFVAATARIRQTLGVPDDCFFRP